jgi:predicted 3-demethylubiquinone-9 3-methyltransferase (glyoxalase superfamily)
VQKITTCLWFNKEAEQAAKYYVSLFKNSKITQVMRNSMDSPGGKKGSVLTVEFKLDGEEFIALNGGVDFPFTEAISLTVNCKDQAEVDLMWKKLSKGGKEVQCGWVKDKYGLSWQVVPVALPKMLRDKNPKKAAAVMGAMLQMVKLDIAKLKQAYDRA